MLEAVKRSVVRLLVELWLETSRHSWRRRVRAKDSPHVHAAGTNPDRVLIAGDGAATGRGVVTHDLGLSGHLARSLSARTGRATDVDIMVAPDMTAVSCLDGLGRLDLGRFDIVLLALGANEALALAGLREWRLALDEVLADLEAKAPRATEIFLLPIPRFGINPHFPRFLARVIDREVDEMNAVTRGVLALRPRADLIPMALEEVYEPRGPHIYQVWAEAIADRISSTLDPGRPSAGGTDTRDELGRQSSLDRLDLQQDRDHVLDRLTETARQAFGTMIAAVTLVRSDVQIMKSTSGIEPIVLPRSEAFCDMTIRKASHFVIEDARLDSRFADYSMVRDEPAVRFYAGYPIESPDGQRVGALCIMDPEPRQFTLEDAAVLRSLAQGVQAHLWNGSLA
ncbi:GAF domain-containing protein [Frondihabitans cladoniiphilus]|uniref:GAF domain-containing protein n=1 Tax=Frondihabitans cladoniiphilus TaxID=715785 RepID=A0ABP8VY75_9MICO